jgi:hypothetical protein
MRGTLDDRDSGPVLLRAKKRCHWQLASPVGLYRYAALRACSSPDFRLHSVVPNAKDKAITGFAVLSQKMV